MHVVLVTFCQAIYAIKKNNKTDYVMYYHVLDKFKFGRCRDMANSVDQK